MKATDFTVDVVRQGSPTPRATLVGTVVTPDPGASTDPPVVCFLLPGGGYNRRYFLAAPPGLDGPSQAEFHAARGWVVVALDHLGVGDSTVPDEPLEHFEAVADADAIAIATVVDRLRRGTLVPDLPPIDRPFVVGAGHSMGGCLAIVAQAHHRCFNALGVLGFSAVHTTIPSAPGQPTLPVPWIARSSGLAEPVLLNPDQVTGQQSTFDAAQQAATGEQHPWRWAFHHDDAPPALLELDLGGEAPAPWHSPTTPMCALKMVTPGVVASEAASVTVPVFLGFGERDVSRDPRSEPGAYRRAPTITVTVVDRMAHLHSFASTRGALWSQLHDWGRSAACRATGPASTT